MAIIRYKVFSIHKDLWKEDPGLSTGERKILSEHIGDYVAAEKSERGYRIVVSTLSSRREECGRLAERKLKEGD